MDSFSHPFRLSGGRVVTIDDQTDEFAAQMIAAAIKTAPGELPITTDFGSRPAEFSTLDTAGVIYSISRYHPLVTIEALVEKPTDSQLEIMIEFTRRDA